MQHGELISCCGSRLVNEFFLRFSFFNFNDTFKTGEALFYSFFELVFFTNYNIKWQWDSRKRGSKCNWFLSSACQVPLLMTEGETRCLPTPVAQVLKSRSGCKNSEKIWWMIEFLNTETHPPVLLMKYLWSLCLRDVRIWVSTVFPSKQSSMCNSGAGLGHPMDPVVSVQNKNLTGNSKKLAKVFGARWET